MIVHGSCHCGAITFEAEIHPEEVFLTHSADGRALSGAAFGVLVPCRRNAFYPVSGTPRFYIKQGEGGRRRAIAFCGNCGSPIHSTDADDREADFILPTGILSEVALLPPRRQVWTDNAVPWLSQIPRLPGRPRS
ncbi:MAG: GFA family protein [Pseudomonadota bacterium]